MRTTLNDELLAKLRNSFEKHEIGNDEQVKIIRWVEHILIGSGIVDNVKLGRFEIVKINDDGEPSFTLSPEGESRANYLTGKSNTLLIEGDECRPLNNGEIRQKGDRFENGIFVHPSSFGQPYYSTTCNQMFRPVGKTGRKPLK